MRCVEIAALIRLMFAYNSSMQLAAPQPRRHKVLMSFRYWNAWDVIFFDTDRMRTALREHNLGQMAIDHFELGFPLESQHKWIFALPVFSNRRVKLRELLEARQLINHKPDLFLSGLRCAQQAHDK